MIALSSRVEKWSKANEMGIRTCQEVRSEAVSELYFIRGPSSLDTHWPRTCCSRLSIMLTACCSMINLVCGFSVLRWSWHMRPSSLKASLMSRTRSRSRALFANLRSFSRSALISTGRSSSSSPSRLAKSQWQMRREETTARVQFTVNANYGMKLNSY